MGDSAICFKCYSTENIHRVSSCRKFIYFSCDKNIFLVSSKNKGRLPFGLICDFCLKENLGRYFYIYDIYNTNKSRLHQLDKEILHQTLLLDGE